MMTSLRPFEPCKPEDKDRFCTYHVALGHHTNNCEALLSAFRKLIKDGRIKESTPRPSTTQNPLPKFGNRVNMVETGPNREEQIIACIENSVMVINKGTAQNSIFDLIRKINPTVHSIQATEKDNDESFDLKAH